MLAANRIGKTESVGGYETTMHLTGLYPDWWPGYRFDRPIKAWAAGATSETVRDIIQAKLFGPADDRGTGLIPHACMGRIRAKPGIPDGIDTARIRHISGGWSNLSLKTYEQGRKAYEGTEQDLIWLDEEPPYDIYGECVMRTMSTVPGRRGGLVIATFTPLEGMSQTVMHFLPEGIQ